MSMRYLGESFDLHGGGKDLVFPHHVNEIAQSEGATGQTFSRYWMHCEFLTEGETKMSKSLGNIRTVHALIEAGWEPRAIRYALMTAHYRKPLSFTEETLEQAAAALKRLDNLVGRLDSEPRGHGSGPLAAEAASAVASFDAALADDLNLPEALAALHNLITASNQRLDRGEVTAADGRAVLAALAAMDEVLAVGKAGEDEAPAAVRELAARRAAARKGRDYAAADGLRDEILRLGWVVEDIKDGTRLKRK
jgi:cysteinyl-tRNA synthetase